jgi:hypothetical protein
MVNTLNVICLAYWAVSVVMFRAGRGASQLQHLQADRLPSFLFAACAYLSLYVVPRVSDLLDLSLRGRIWLASLYPFWIAFVCTVLAAYSLRGGLVVWTYPFIRLALHGTRAEECAAALWRFEMQRVPRWLVFLGLSVVWLAAASVTAMVLIGLRPYWTLGK